MHVANLRLMAAVGTQARPPGVPGVPTCPFLPPQRERLPCSPPPPGDPEGSLNPAGLGEGGNWGSGFLWPLPSAPQRRGALPGAFPWGGGTS